MSSPFASYFSQPRAAAPPLSALLSLSPLSPQATAHLVSVYKTLAAMAATSASAVYAQQRFNFFHSGGLITFGMLASMLAFSFIPTTKQYESTRRTLLFTFAFFKGLLLVPLIAYADFLSPTMVSQALTSTVLVFLSFSMAAVFAKSRSILYLGGMLMSATSVLFWLSIANTFFVSRTLLDINLYFGLLVFSAYGDVMANALELYFDLISIFIRVLSIMANREADKKKRGSDRKESGSRGNASVHRR